MYVISTFDQSLYIELAITLLEQKGIHRGSILVVPLDKRKEERRIFDTLHRADGVSLFDGAAMLGTCGMLLGAIYGYVLKWGPIIWGLIGLALGFIIGFLFDFFVFKGRRSENRQMPKTRKKVAADVVLIVYCSDEQSQLVEQVLWEHLALGVARLA